MNSLNKYLRAIDVINMWVGRICAFLIIPMTVLLIYEVFRRYVLNSPTVWTNELCQMLFGTYAVLSGGYILLIKGHTNVDILVSSLSPKIHAILDIATFIIFLIFISMLIYFGGSLAWDSLSILEGTESAWNPPAYIVKSMIPIGAVLLLLQGIAKFVRDILTLRNGDGMIADDTERGAKHEH